MNTASLDENILNKSSERVHEENSSSSDPTSGSEAEDVEPARKKRKRELSVDAKIEALFNQVSALTNIIMHQQCVPSANNNQTIETIDDDTREFFINPEAACSKSLDLGTCRTDFDNKKFIKPADGKRLKQMVDLQHFNSPTWQHVRYSKTLHEMIAQPGFCNLKINDELCCLNRGKDYLAPTELVIAALTNTLLQQRELLQSGLQNIIDWGHNNPGDLNSDNLFKKITESFGKSSESYKLSEHALQIACGKRAECIETRRQRLISEISDKNIQKALSNIPPSEEYLFEKTQLSSLIQSLGGPHFWLSQSRTNNKDKNTFKRKHNEPTPSTSRAYPHYKNNISMENVKQQQTKQIFKNKIGSNRPSSFRNNKKK